MGEDDKRIVQEILRCFIENGLKPRRFQFGGKIQACALGALVTDSGYRSKLRRWTAATDILRRFLPDVDEAGVLRYQEGIACGFDGEILEEDEGNPFFRRGYKVGRAVWDHLKNPPKEQDVERRAGTRIGSVVG